MSKAPNSGPDPGGEPTIPGKIDASSSPIEKVSAFASFGVPNFRPLFAGSILANAGQWIQQVVLSWLVYDLTGSGTILGVINLVQTMASVSMIPPAGIMVDRLHRGKLLFAENAASFLIRLVLGLALLLGHANMAYLFIFSFLAGTVQTVDRTLRQVLIFDLLPRQHAPNGVAIIQTGWSLMRVIGPALGGFLILWVGAGGNFLIQAGAYALIGVTILQIRFPARKVDMVGSSVFKNLRDGIRYVAKERVTRSFMLLGVVLPLLTIPIFSILPPIYAVKVFNDNSGRVLGLLMASVGVGGIIGGIITASLGRLFEHRGRLELVALLLLNLSLLAFALSSTLFLALLFMAVSGIFEMVFLVTNQTIVQLSIPDDLRGRVTAVVGLGMAVMPLGGLVAGVGADLLGPKMITIIMAALAMATAVAVLPTSPTVRNYRYSEGLSAFSSGITDADEN